MKRRKNKYIPPKAESSAKNDQFSFKKLIAILLVVNLLTTGVSFAYCMRSESGSDFARVAKFAVQVTPPDDTEFPLDKPLKTGDSVPYEVEVVNNSDVAVSCSAVLTVGKYDGVSKNKFKVSCQLDDNMAQTLSSLPSEGQPQTFSNLGAIPPRGEGTVKLIFTAASEIQEDYKNDYIHDLKFSITFDQID